jgi:hypothetical protein
MKSHHRLLANAVLAVLCSTVASAEPQATNPEAIRGTWCYVKSIDPTGKTIKEVAVGGGVDDETQVFRRSSCAKGLGYVFTARSVIGKSNGKQIGEHPLVSVEFNDRAGWFINVKHDHEQTGRRVFRLSNDEQQSWHSWPITLI